MIANVFGLFILTLCIIKTEKDRCWLFENYFSILITNTFVFRYGTDFSLKE